MKSILVIAGEVSGDMHAADVVRAARALAPDLRFFGVGGERLRDAGMEILVDAREMAVLGLWEVVKRYGFFRRVFADLLRAADERRPDAVLLIDYPGFNLRFAEEMKRRGIPVLYYICPQVWAWHRSRIPKMAGLLRRLMVIFPFEVDVFAGTGLRVNYVGHPLVDEARRELASARDELPWPSPAPGGGPGAPRVALLPGSRRQELERILPVMWQAAGALERRVPGVGFVLAAASEEAAGWVRDITARAGGGPSRCVILAGATRQVLREATAAMVKSGTSTIEAALMNCPMIVVYKASPITYFFGRMLVRVPHLGMVNLIAGREAFREFLQDAATPEALASAVAPLLDETSERAAALAALRDVQAKLGDGGAAERAAAILVEELSQVRAR